MWDVGQPERQISLLGQEGDVAQRRRSENVLLGLLLLMTVEVAACIASLFLTMREVLALGGFVAGGGPYEIAHPAPDWIWLVPVSIAVGAAFAVAHVALAAAAGRPALLWGLWSGTFLALGYNFLDFGLAQRGAGGIEWAWLLCGVVFVGMGLSPPYGLVAVVWMPERLASQVGPAYAEGQFGRRGGLPYLLLQAAAAALGAGLGVFLTRLIIA